MQAEAYRFRIMAHSNTVVGLVSIHVKKFQLIILCFVYCTFLNKKYGLKIHIWIPLMALGSEKSLKASCTTLANIQVTFLTAAEWFLRRKPFWHGWSLTDESSSFALQGFSSGIAWEFSDEDSFWLCHWNPEAVLKGENVSLIKHQTFQCILFCWGGGWFLSFFLVKNLPEKLWLRRPPGTAYLPAILGHCHTSCKKGCKEELYRHSFPGMSFYLPLSYLLKFKEGGREKHFNRI